MANFTLFLNAFLSYFLLFVLIAALAVGCVFLGIKLRKNKDAKAVEQIKAEE